MQDQELQRASQSNEGEVYLTRCASCGGQFPTFRAICSECEDGAEDDGFRVGKKILSRDSSLEPSTAEEALV